MKCHKLVTVLLIMALAIFAKVKTVQAVICAQYISTTLPGSVRVGSTMNFNVIWKNASCSTAWDNTINTNGTRLCSRFNSADIQGVTTCTGDNLFAPMSCIYAPYSVAVGSNQAFTFNTTAPETPGVYKFATMFVWDGVYWGGSCPEGLTFEVTQTAPTITVSVSNPNAWVKSGDKLNISGTITDPDTQNWTVSYSLSGSTTPSSWVVCRSASSTRMEGSQYKTSSG